MSQKKISWEDVTDKQIKMLRSEAWEACDWDTVDLCDQALQLGPGFNTYALKGIAEILIINLS